MTQNAKISIEQAIQDLQNLTKQKLTYVQIGQVLGLSRQAIGTRIARGTGLQEFEWQKLKEHFVPFDPEEYKEKLLSDYTKRVEDFELPPEIKKILLLYYNQGIDLNWVVTREGEKYRKKELAGLKDEIKQAVREMIASGELKDEFK